jgi:hypothetical protein
MAIALIYYGQLRYTYGVGGLFAMYLSGSRTQLFAYIGQFLITLPVTKFLTKHRRKLTFIMSLSILTVLFLIVTNYYLILDAIIINSKMNENKYNSIIVIFEQLGSPGYYKQLLNPFPSLNQIMDDGLYVREVPEVGDGLQDGGNEIGYFAVFNQCGFFLAIAYLIFLLKNTKHYKTFIILSLLHYTYVLSPIGVYMMVEYSRRIELLRNKRIQNLAC